VIGWLDCSAGISGDMLLGALVDAGVELAVLQAAVDGLGVEPIRLVARPVTRAGIGATKVDVEVPAAATTRTWADVRELLEAAELAEAVRSTALAVFARLAAAEAAVHRVPPDEVHFHEVGALDALADIVACAAGLHALGLTELTASPVSLGSGTARGAHGPIPVPSPAVLALLTAVPVEAGPVHEEMTTPTGAALLAAAATAYGPMPSMVLSRTGSGAGGRNPTEVANVLRLVLGEPVNDSAAGAWLLEANVDDLDPRLWPGVLASLLTAGASDAWLTPILMKKGRPAHTLSVLCGAGEVETLRSSMFRETSTIGVRTARVDKHALERREHAVEVAGQPVRVKLGLLGGEVVNVMPEWDDVAAAARALGRPAKAVLLDAHAAASRLKEIPEQTSPGEVFLTTERLVLRHFTAADVDLLVELDSDPAVMHFITGGRPTPRSEIEQEVLPHFLAFYDQPGRYGFWAAVDKATGDFLGWFHLRPAKGAARDEPELGYRLRQAAWGHGYATEGAKALVDVGFEGPGVRRVVAETLAVHVASRRVMEKAGLTLVRTFRQPWPYVIEGDEEGDVEYALLRQTWEARRAAEAARIE